MQEKLESEIGELESVITDAKKQRAKLSLREEQIEQFFHKAKTRLEHPRKYVEKAKTKAEIEKPWETIFTSSPTIQDLKSGTPQLTLLYRLNRDFHEDKKQLVAHLSLHWNTFVEEVVVMLNV